MRSLLTATLVGALVGGAALADVIVEQPYDGTSPAYWAQEFPDFPEMSIWELDDIHTDQDWLVDTLTVIGVDDGPPGEIQAVNGEIWDGLPGVFGGAVVLTSVSGTANPDGTLTIDFGGQELPAGDHWITGWVVRDTAGFNQDYFWFATTPVNDSEEYVWNPGGAFWDPDPLPGSEAFGGDPRDLAFTLEGTPAGGLLGDMNCDGAVNAYDIDGFICALSPTCDYEGLYPDCDRMLADINGDGVVNSYDIDGFIDLVGGG